jgi:hypothetical protein
LKPLVLVLLMTRLLLQMAPKKRSCALTLPWPGEQQM